MTDWVIAVLLLLVAALLGMVLIQLADILTTLRLMDVAC